jgi:hypothetical protein
MRRMTFGANTTRPLFRLHSGITSIVQKTAGGALIPNFSLLPNRRNEKIPRWCQIGRGPAEFPLNLFVDKAGDAGGAFDSAFFVALPPGFKTRALR